MIEQIKLFKVECDGKYSAECLGETERKAPSKKDLQEDLFYEGWEIGDGYHPRWDTPVKSAICPKCKVWEAK